MLSHLSILAFAIIAPLIINLTLGKRSRFVRDQAVEALNYHLTVMIVWLVGFFAGLILALATVGIALVVLVPLFALAWVASIVWGIIASVDAWHGRPYRYPVCWRMVS